MQTFFRWLWLMFVSLTLVACSSTFKTASASNQSKKTAARSGAYFQNDGPADHIPVNLDLVPDAVPQQEALIRSANLPYSALGERYRPVTDVKDYEVKGKASWYGKQFHGRKTSSGERYDMFAMTAAHPTLPIPSYARVTNLRNGKSVIVRINDRGPFHKSRIMDLSYAAAYKLGYVDQGHANVEIALVLPEEVAMVPAARPVPPIRRAKAPAPIAVAARPVAAPVVAAVEAARPAVSDAASAVPAPQSVVAARAADKSHGEVFLQLGSFGTAGTAEHFKSFVEYELKWLKESVSVLASEGKYRLRVGPFPSALEARSIAERIAGTLKLKPAVVQR